MEIWWITLYTTFFCCLFARIRWIKYINKYSNDYIQKSNRFLVCISVLILILVSGLRINVGDTQIYMNKFEEIPSNFSEAIRSSAYISQDKGFYIFSSIIKTFISENVQIYILILAAVTIILIYITLYKYTDNLEMAIFIFIAAGNYLVSMNAVRQYLVSAIIFYCFPLIYKKRWYIYIPIVFLASTLHGSAIIFIPLYFIINAKAWGKISKILLFGGILAYIAYPITGSFLAKLLENTNYSVYGDGLISGVAGASSIIRTLVYAVPIVLAYVKRREIEHEHKYFNIVLNFSIINLIFMLLSNAASWIFARYCIYFSLYMIILLCWCINSFKNIKEKRIIYYLCIVLY
ncbi:EpsG family protein, partial [Clostridium perfringens]